MAGCYILDIKVLSAVFEPRRKDARIGGIGRVVLNQERKDYRIGRIRRLVLNQERKGLRIGRIGRVFEPRKEGVKDWQDQRPVIVGDVSLNVSCWMGCRS